MLGGRGQEPFTPKIPVAGPVPATHVFYCH
jgi:hypothetical protein